MHSASETHPVESDKSSPQTAASRLTMMGDATTVQALLSRSRSLLVISGAGCSTASGIGDYRDDQGRWKSKPPVQHGEFMSSHTWRQRYWARSQLGYPEFLRARPNKAHHILAGWARSSGLLGVITQNVDGLHQQAGQPRVIDLHGRLDKVVCTGCGLVQRRAQVQEFLEQHNAEVSGRAFHMAPDGDADVLQTGAMLRRICVPACPSCGGIVKPDVVFFGDSVPQSRVDRAYTWLAQADLVLVVGSSLMVYSGYRFVRRAHQLGIPIIAVNRGKTRADNLLSGKIVGDCGTVLENLVFG